MSMASSSLGLIFAFSAIASIITHLAVLSEAQNPTQPTTDPDQGSLSPSFSSPTFSVFGGKSYMMQATLYFHSIQLNSFVCS